MTQRKTFKRRVRTRMDKTGERYTAARRHLLEREAESEPGPEPEQPADGPSDAAAVRATGRRLADWFALLDEWGAAERSHGEIARHLQGDHGVSGWWAQSLTVLYERARGRRAKHEGPAGFAVGASKTVGVPVDRLHDAFVDEEQRERWLPEGGLRLRTAQPGRSARFDWDDGATRVNVYFTAKGEQKSSVSVQHERLPDAEEAERVKAAWRERLARLKEVAERNEPRA